MTFANIPLAIDGALTESSLIRKGFFAAMEKAGVVEATDLAVSPNVPAGQSLRVAPGLAAVENGYQVSPDEFYIVNNPDIHTIGSGEMPPSSPGTTYWMVAIVIGDPNPAYSQAGHPFMPSDFDEAQANTFQYVRAVVLPCSSTATKFSDLGKSYPGLALARLTIPPSTTTITSGMITDLRPVIRTPDVGWTALPVTGNMSGAISYARTGKTVHIEMRGSKSSVNGAVLGTLPVGFRPATQVIRPSLQLSGVLSGVGVNANGDIVSDFGTGAYGGFSFPAA